MKRFETNLELDKSGFHQTKKDVAKHFSGSTLTMSGTTDVYGQFIFESGATVQILDNAGLGKVWISDENGVGGWKEITGTTITRYTITGDSFTTGFTITHNKNNEFVTVEITKNISPYSTIYTCVTRPTANTIYVTFNNPPPNGLEYNILVSS